MATSSKRTYARTLRLLGLLLPVSLILRQATADPHLCWRLLAQSFVGCLLLSPGSQCTQVLFLPSRVSVSSVLWKFHNHIPLTFKVKFPAGRGGVAVGRVSQSLCWIPRLGNLLWALELSHQCKNFFGIIVLQVMGHLLSDSIMELMMTSFKRTYAPHHTSEDGAARAPIPLQATADPWLHRRHSDIQRQVWLSLLWRSLLISLGLSAHKVLLVPSKHLWWV